MDNCTELLSASNKSSLLSNLTLHHILLIVFVGSAIPVLFIVVAVLVIMLRRRCLIGVRQSVGDVIKLNNNIEPVASCNEHNDGAKMSLHKMATFTDDSCKMATFIDNPCKMAAFPDNLERINNMKETNKVVNLMNMEDFSKTSSFVDMAADSAASLALHIVNTEHRQQPNAQTIFYMDSMHTAETVCYIDSMLTKA